MVVVLSKKYTERPWCMRELDLVLHGDPQYPRQQQPLVIPVYYDDPKSLPPERALKENWEERQQQQQHQQQQGSTVPPDCQPCVHPGRWLANIKQMREDQQIRLSSFTTKDAQWQVAQKIVAAAAPHVVVLAYVPEYLVGYEKQLGLLLSKLATGDPSLGDMLGLWLHGLGEQGLPLSCMD
jgi:hypothetical protein